MLLPILDRSFNHRQTILAINVSIFVRDVFVIRIF